MLNIILFNVGSYSKLLFVKIENQRSSKTIRNFFGVKLTNNTFITDEHHEASKSTCFNQKNPFVQNGGITALGNVIETSGRKTRFTPLHLGYVRKAFSIKSTSLVISETWI